MDEPNWPAVRVELDAEGARIYVAGIHMTSLEPGPNTRLEAMDAIKRVAASYKRTLPVEAVEARGTYQMLVSPEGVIEDVSGDKGAKRGKTLKAAAKPSPPTTPVGEDKVGAVSDNGGSGGVLPRLDARPASLSPVPRPAQVDEGWAQAQLLPSLHNLPLPYAAQSRPRDTPLFAQPVAPAAGQSPPPRPVRRKPVGRLKRTAVLMVCGVGFLAVAVLSAVMALHEGDDEVFRSPQSPSSSPVVSGSPSVSASPSASEPMSGRRVGSPSPSPSPSAQESKRAEQVQQVQEEPGQPVEPAPAVEQAPVPEQTQQEAQAPAQPAAPVQEVTDLRTSVGSAGSGAARFTVSVQGSGTVSVTVSVGGRTGTVTVTAPGSGSVTVSGIPKGSQSWTSAVGGLSNSGSINIY